MNPRKSPSSRDQNRRCNQNNNTSNISIAELNLNAEDYAVLITARYFFASFAEPDQTLWTQPVLHSDAFFPHHSDHRANVQAVLHYIQTIRSTRRSVLMFSNPGCSCCSSIVTEPERHMIEILRNIQHGQRSKAHTHALLLCEGNDVGHVMQAATKLANLLSPSHCTVN